MSWAQVSAARNSHPPSRGSASALHLSLFVFFLAALCAASGCKKTEPGSPPPARIHAITKELADAARSAAPPGTQVHPNLAMPDNTSESADLLDITLTAVAPESAARSSIAKIQQALGTVATHHGLTQQPSESREGILFYYLKGGVRTHAVHIHIGTPLSGQAGNAPPSSSNPKLAIILDDLGSDRGAAEAIFDLPYPLTISVLPNHEHSNEIAQEAERRGYQVLLHLPMQAIANERPEAQELRPGMPAAQVSALVDEFLQNVPGAVGVNNHQGSQATADPVLMGELMPALRDRHLFYIDSRTTAKTVAYNAAHSAGIPSAFRNVPFLDDVAQFGPVQRQLEIALRDAREKGEAVAIGHPHPATLQALREELPRVQTQGVRLVFVSDLVH